ncbi:MAG: hydrogenase iron-sulfur subunit [Proteobacteria bacterium]|nr:hydrogenase iron-sulfur subunit [Pseudomonadota bacterium]
MKHFEPTVVAFCCMFCAQPAQSGARPKKIKQLPPVRVIKLHCIGRIDSVHVLKAFENGADAVFLAGAPQGQCRFIQGTAAAQKKIEYTRKLLKEVGIEPERLEMFTMSAAKAPTFTKAADEMTKRAMALGPSPLKKGKKKAEAA